MAFSRQISVSSWERGWLMCDKLIRGFRERSKREPFLKSSAGFWWGFTMRLGALWELWLTYTFNSILWTSLLALWERVVFARVSSVKTDSKCRPAPPTDLSSASDSFFINHWYHIDFSVLFKYYMLYFLVDFYTGQNSDLIHLAHTSETYKIVCFF